MTTQKLRLIKRDPSKAYVSNMLWLPKNGVSEMAVKEALQLWTIEKNAPTLNTLWDETDTHIICPREFLSTDTYGSFPFPIVDISPKKFPRIGLRSKITLRGNQIAAYDAFLRAKSGVLNLAPGKGKTVLALQRAVDAGCPALIVVHNTYLWEQWQERINDHLELPIGQSIGRIQGGEFDWHRPITIAMIHTLAARARRGDIPLEFRRHFGIAFFDEVHHLSAPYFVLAAPLTDGLRYGLTATANRLDGTEFIYKYHIGQVFYTDLTQDLQPRIYFQLTPISIDLDDKDLSQVRDVTGQVNIPKIRSYVGKMAASNEYRAGKIRAALKEGRKVLALSHSKAQLIELSAMFPGSGLIIQETPQEDRTRIVLKSRICFAIASLGAEGLDDDMLDTLFILTPFGSPNDLQQFMGRIQREKPGKRTPVVVIFDDLGISPFHKLCFKLKKTLRSWNMPFEIVPM